MTQSNIPAPKVFLSHASEDKQRFVVAFATALRSKGIDVWLDRWEILPGDSLVDKLFEEGLKEAEAVLIVISAVSVTKPWVREELNTAIVNRITRQTKVIPIVLDSAEVPEALRSLVWEPVPDLNNYGPQLDRVVAGIFGHRDKPALGKSPDYLKEHPIPGLHPSDTRVLRAIYEDAVDRNHPIWSPEEFASRLEDLSQEAMLDSLEILEEQGYIKIKRLLGGMPRGIGVIQPTLNGFMVFARANLPEIEEKIRKVALAVLNEGMESALTITESTQIAPFIVENVLDLFASRGWLKVSNTLSDKHVYSVSPSMKRALA
ncbi:toll/interleukin-1 receptor domain-containing protein [Edaphobacter sp. HDX4]|uniref:toll/interleukin-1 receptor domain-containing protein n=1 Tax=Edaphobacter sp. HDX4 TaxID=2794064 RepID=UPI002FE643FF